MTNKSSATIVVNIKKEKCDVYCGRGSPFGNPYIIGRDGTRNDVCDNFIHYFYKKLNDSQFRNKVIALKGKRLGCWCKPLRCHCDSIVEYLENKS